MDIHLYNYGAKLRVRDGLFEIRYADEKMHIHKEQFSPNTVESIWLQNGTSASVAAIELAIRNSVDLLFLDIYGNPTGRVISNRPNNSTEVLKAQLRLSDTPKALCYAREWVVQKLKYRQAFLIDLKSYRNQNHKEYLDKQASKIGKLKDDIAALSIKDKHADSASIRGLEGTAGKIYFKTLSDLLPKEYRFEKRSFRPANDVFNAFLNYGYGMLYAVTERALLLAGINPYIGFMHRDDHQRKSMVFDFIEPYRTDTERAVFKLFSQKKVRSVHFQNPGDHIYLSKAGRRLIVKAFNKQYRNQKKSLANKYYALHRAIHKEARHFASLIKKELRNQKRPLAIA